MAAAATSVVLAPTLNARQQVKLAPLEFKTTAIQAVISFPLFAKCRGGTRAGRGTQADFSDRRSQYMGPDLLLIRNL